MKNFHIILIPIFITASASADVLSDLSPFLSNSRFDYDPASIEPDSALQNPNFAPFSPADSDIGVQQVLGSYQGLPPVKFSFETSLNYTNKAPAEIPPDDAPSWFSASRLDVSWYPRIASGWFADMGLAQEVFRFEGSKAIDFENFEPHLGVAKSIPELDDLIFFSRYEYQRITSDRISKSNYSAQRIRTGFQKDYFFVPNQQLYLGVDAAFDLTAHYDEETRNSYSTVLNYTYWFADRLNATLSWSGSFWDFRNDGRKDFGQIVGVEFKWAPCENATVYSNLFYTNHNSNSAFGANDLKAWQSGIGVGMNFSF